MNTATIETELTEGQIETIRRLAQDRDTTIKAIRSALRDRSGKQWSVTGGRGTAWGWITIFVPPARLTDYNASPEDLAELGTLLGLGKPVHFQGANVPASSDYRRVWLCRAIHGHAGPFTAEAYWD